VHTLIDFEQNKLIENLQKTNDTILSIVLYGSYANGENDSKSDIDLFLLLNEKKPVATFLQQMEKKLKKIVTIQMMTIPEWHKLKEKDKIFYESILEKHIVLWGSGLP